MSKKTKGGQATVSRKRSVEFELDNGYFDDLRVVARAILDAKDIPDDAIVEMMNGTRIVVDWRA